MKIQGKTEFVSAYSPAVNTISFGKYIAVIGWPEIKFKIFVFFNCPKPWQFSKIEKSELNVLPVCYCIQQRVKKGKGTHTVYLLVACVQYIQFHHLKSPGNQNTSCEIELPRYEYIINDIDVTKQTKMNLMVLGTVSM